MANKLNPMIPPERHNPDTSGDDMRGGPLPAELLPGWQPVGHPVIAWIVILLVIVSIVAVEFLMGGDSAAERADDGQFYVKVMELQAKYLVGAAELIKMQSSLVKGPAKKAADAKEGRRRADPDPVQPQLQQLYEQSASLNVGPVDHRIRFVILAGELVGAKEAVKRLNELHDKLRQHGEELTAEQARSLDLLGRLYGDYDQQEWNAPSLTRADRDSVKSDLGWFGELALAPAAGSDSPKRESVLFPARVTMGVCVLAFMTGAMLAVAGTGGFAVFLWLLFSGRLLSAFRAGSPRGPFYAETFAVWLLLFVVLSLGVRAVPWPPARMALGVSANFLALMAVVWPVFRGLPWSEVRADIGWTRGRHPLIEMLWGVVCYISSLPLLFFGILLVLFLAMVASALAGGPQGDEFSPMDLPRHPIVDWVQAAGWQGRLLVVVLACLIAPIVEETLFRGVLYRHLRDATAAWRISASVIFSALVNSFLFAAIHPQGLIALPALTSLAFAFSLMREWRGSLLAPMTAHGLNNFMVTMVLFAIL